MTKNSDQKNNLTQLQRAAVAAIVETTTAKEAAEKCGAAESTIYKYLQDPVIMAEVRIYERQRRDTVGYRLAAEAHEHLDVIAGVSRGEIKDTEDVKASVRLRAALGWMDLYQKTEEMTQLEARVTELEARAGHG